MGRYRPPSSDPRRDPFNATHPLGARARKISSGILVVRFALPFHIYCLGCNTHLAQGRRFNAEKSHVDDYLSIKIYAFRCKCPCGAWIEIRTDPQHACYVVHAGARKQIQDWDPLQHGGHAIYDTEAKKDEGDAFAKVQGEEELKRKKRKWEQRVGELEEQQQKWKDPYTVNANLRRGFRSEKHATTVQMQKDCETRDAIGWNHDRLLLPTSPETDAKDRLAWRANRKPNTCVETASPAQRLKNTILANSRRKADAQKSSRK
ncbi:DUF572-domain-containing protein [Moesziomyces antarcticus]|uniref:Related to YJU2 - essential protein required for pre-mRNA splicing n=2 Tax=Pseudozyma antarctica TaxID=84753 RepID=A0A5C3FRD2_PSEA2|nr:DUF572-domain-containing protein [Moesziomyces antarcticus]GAK66015.1 DUF572-domain-containing protein [Moesziomyces antarcticus]SPO46790.1 related to YJU2 - essential protein required for pre-mRNA splicing [Moesziomyces antarcticus]